ncbi:MAG: zinc ribbon domain-containing protein [Deltaproteobacteria bacterium]|jgi:putative FmdB family regulatory protein|nr:zinc ribbon domain-containing protein [Deltaproteobacteria bacterium]
MPIYEFQCAKCKHRFEELVFGQAVPPCPHCGGKESERLISRPARRSSSKSGEAQAGEEYGGGEHGGGCSSCAGGNCSCCGH